MMTIIDLMLHGHSTIPTHESGKKLAVFMEFPVRRLLERNLKTHIDPGVLALSRT